MAAFSSVPAAQGASSPERASEYLARSFGDAAPGDSAKHVYCPHCGTTTPSREPVGATMPCSGCGRRLEIYRHFSRRTARYLGLMADAEEPLPSPASPELEAAR
jgi:hypothetical protein